MTRMPAAPDTCADLGGNPNSADLFVTRTREIPLARKCSATPASRTLRRSPTALRPEVEAILLHGARPVAQQIAAALSGRHGLHTVYIIAHGPPGRVGFAAGHLDVGVLMAHPASAWRND